MTINKDEIRRLAEAATPGDWSHEWNGKPPYSEGEVSAGENIIAIVAGGNYGQWRDSDDAGEYEFKANGDFIAAANPATILALLDELEAAQRDAERYRWLREISAATTGTVPMVSKVDESGSRVGVWVYGEKLDAVMDAAMAKEGG